MKSNRAACYGGLVSSLAVDCDVGEIEPVVGEAFLCLSCWSRSVAAVRATTVSDADNAEDHDGE